MTERCAVRIRRNWETGKLYVTPMGFDVSSGSKRMLDSAIQWDGKGLAFIGREVMDFRLYERSPEPCDVIELDGEPYVVIARMLWLNGYCLMRESRAAHLLAMFLLTYWSDLIARQWMANALRRLHPHHFLDMQAVLDEC